MNKWKRFYLLGASIFSLTVILSLLSTPFAAAQDEKAKEELVKEKARGEHELGTMTVTAQKREENIQNVPMSISVFSDIQVEDADIRDTIDLTRFIPNVYLKKATSENIIVIRGIPSFDGSIYGPAGFYVDDVALPLHYMHNPEMFDVERVEVLRGPQGTLYGKNTESGVINIITKKPDNTFRAKVFGEYGFYDNAPGDSNTYRGGANIAGPLVKDRLYLGLAGQWKDSGGYMENEFDNDDEVADYEHKDARATLRWTPADRWDISLGLDVLDYDESTAYYRFINGPYETDRCKVNYNGLYSSDQQSNGQTLRVKYEGDAFSLLSVTGRRDYETNFKSDCDLGPLDWGNNFYAYENDVLSQEVRVTSPENSGPLEWLVGFYAFNEQTDVDLEIQMRGTRKITNMDVDGYAFFGQATYTLFNRLHLTGGIRYDDLEQEGKQRSTSSGVHPFFPPGDSTYEKDLDDDEVLPKFAVAFDFTDNAMAYASASRGYLNGSYNYGAGDSVENLAYDPEYTWNYEVGIKTSWLDNRLMANLAVFYIDMEDKQAIETIPGGPIGMRTIRNAAEAHSQGLELELQARPARGLDLFAGLGIVQSEFDDWTASEMDMMTGQFVTYDYEDKDLPHVPEYTYNLGVQYRHESSIFGRVDLLGTGEQYCDSKNTDTLKIDDYHLVNLRLGYEAERFDVILWARNVFDEEYYGIMYDYGGPILAIDGDPRMFGVTLTCRF